ncbi:heat stress transcription factor C-1b [Thecamonas trahens ATCC 50062]|uniref:Heat stress transcription factor C-1b n=1 Tax=Thecamonas trahens ATCC 50062 TaxID=461836 RepID=A0A0L0DRH6_THETB|nr:heat stress transcription factor C-1b [Thecamonas trahens ATCC 50062]KNC54890.1 heat stress transcription factor C-1b [Thecamonas trahens ATCC 50062]|eukprot:XP_013753481.1 heat stress transcription factor C-1b [Thecamonas trahens ATCC 50062]
MQKHALHTSSPKKKISPFLTKAFELVSDPETDALIRWKQDGRSFEIVGDDELAAEILPRFFKHGRIASMHRQFNLYGFRKVRFGDPSDMSFYHKCFIRDRPDLLANIVRNRKPAGADVEVRALALQSEVESLKRKRSEMESELTLLASGHTELQSRLDAAEETVVALRSELADTQQTTLAMHETVSALIAALSADQAGPTAAAAAAAAAAASAAAAATAAAPLAAASLPSAQRARSERSSSSASASPAGSRPPSARASRASSRSRPRVVVPQRGGGGNGAEASQPRTHGSAAPPLAAAMPAASEGPLPPPPPGDASFYSLLSPTSIQALLATPAASSSLHTLLHSPLAALPGFKKLKNLNSEARAAYSSTTLADLLSPRPPPMPLPSGSSASSAAPAASSAAERASLALPLDTPPSLRHFLSSIVPDIFASHP